MHSSIYTISSNKSKMSCNFKVTIFESPKYVILSSLQLFTHKNKLFSAYMIRYFRLNLNTVQNSGTFLNSY